MVSQEHLLKFSSVVRGQLSIQQQDVFICSVHKCSRRPFRCGNPCRGSHLLVGGGHRREGPLSALGSLQVVLCAAVLWNECWSL